MVIFHGYVSSPEGSSWVFPFNMVDLSSSQTVNGYQRVVDVIVFSILEITIGSLWSVHFLLEASNLLIIGWCPFGNQALLENPPLMKRKIVNNKSSNIMVDNIGMMILPMFFFPLPLNILLGKL